MADLKIGDEVYVHGYIDEIRKDTVIIKNDGGYFGTVSDEIMPSAQPERKKGKWIKITDHETPVVCKCTECGWLTTHYDSFAFCPNCGADMRGEENDTD